MTVQLICFMSSTSLCNLSQSSKHRDRVLAPAGPQLQCGGVRIQFFGDGVRCGRTLMDSFANDSGDYAKPFGCQMGEPFCFVLAGRS